MSNSSTNRLRRSLPTSKTGIYASTAEFFSRRDIWMKILVCSIATLTLWVFTLGWAPAFPYRMREAPLRDMYSRTNFEAEDLRATEEKREREKRKISCFYENDRQALIDLRAQLIDDVFAVKQKSSEEVTSNVWSKFLSTTDTQSMDHNDPLSDLNKFREALEQDESLETLTNVIQTVMHDIEENGLLENLEHEFQHGSMQEIKVYNKGTPEDALPVSVDKVRIAKISDELKDKLLSELQKESAAISNSKLVADRLFDWIRPQLATTLKWDKTRSKNEQSTAAKNVKREMKEYRIGDPLDKELNDVDRLVIRADVPLDDADIKLLRKEHEAVIANMTFWQKMGRSAWFFGTFFVIFSLLSSYLVNRDRKLLDDIKHFSILVGLTFATFLLGWVLASFVEWRAEIIPFVIFAMIVSIAYSSELAIFLCSLAALAFTILHGYGVAEFVILSASTCTSAMLCGKIRSRTKLVYVGLVTATIIFPIAIGINNLLGQPISNELWMDGLWYASSAGLAGVFMTILLPFIERVFDIQTDISLLELSDANHPLLKQLVQQAPGTYNHSINVASISEAAAKSIGANGLLCRVGAYFHDIGKIRKPEYFIENQGGGENKHDDLEPTMSTIVIVAHVKDGAEMARQHKLPQRIIDLIEQHHGTTVVEYFYNRAIKQCEGDEDAQAVEADDFRYPGPKPQTPEAAVMMLADSVESASRALREPAPARIESLVTAITKKKLNDGQLDECSITLQQLHTVEESMIKSLNAMYHGRVKYPEQQTEKQPPEKQMV